MIMVDTYMRMRSHAVKSGYVISVADDFLSNILIRTSNWLGQLLAAPFPAFGRVAS
jgi:hypothetical protein